MHKFTCAVRAALITAVLACAALDESRAAVTVVGDVYPADNISTPAIEGIPSSGNVWNTLEPNNAQSRWETNLEIIVGKSLMMGGRMDIDTSTNLRYTNLILGDRDETTGRVGTGTVLITGTGALYSNDPLSLPPGLPPDYAPTASAARPEDIGFDLWVGRWGQGRFELRNGGRAEIQDAVIVGDNPGASGVVTVDGFGSLLGSGAFNAISSIGEPHQMIIGRQGNGQMYITNGALVVSEGPEATSNTIVVGAVIGSDAFEDTQRPVLGGSGVVWLSGNASRWIVGGSLQIGGFHNASEDTGPDADGDSVLYNGGEGQAGSGTLIVDTNSQVVVRAGLGAVPDDELLMAIGRFGTLDLRGGQIAIGGGVGGTQPQPTSDEVVSINDGLIKGYGRIITGGFRNRYYGQLRVAEGESLVIESTAEFQDPAQDEYPLINFGLIEVLGTEEMPAELEFVRAPGVPGSPLAPLINRPVETIADPAPTTFEGGMISAQHSRLRFTSGGTDDPNGPIGMKNEGVMAFTAGTNIITGHVVNKKGDDPSALEPRFLIGPNTTVVVEDNFTVDSAVIGPGNTASGPIIDLGQGATLIVLDQSTMTLAGVLSMDLSVSNPSSIEMAGDLGLGGVLNATLSNDALATLGHGSAFEIISFGGQAFTIDTSGPVAQPSSTPIAQGGAGFSQINVSPDLSLLYPTLDAVVQRSGQSFFLSFLDPGMVGVGAIGGDFNGDGVVDQADLAIWQANKGITSGASILQGDADGDGDVDGADYLKWLEQFTNGGVPMPGASPSPAGSVPEPAGLALLSMGAVLMQAFRRRRR